MTSKTRRSISLKGITYQRLQDYCEAQGESVSGLVEEIANERLDELGVPVPEEVTKPRPKRRAASWCHLGVVTF